MKKKKYFGLFTSDNGDNYTLDVYCNGFIQAFILLTSDAIRSGKHYQLNTITDENGGCRKVDDILKLSSLLS